MSAKKRIYYKALKVVVNGKDITRKCNSLTIFCNRLIRPMSQNIRNGMLIINGDRKQFEMGNSTFVELEKQ